MSKRLKELKDATLTDDYMFGQVMGQEKIAKAFLEILLGCEIKEISYISRQVEFKDALTNHGIRLDIYLNDENGTHYDIEMQTTNQYNLEKRVRYHQGMIDGDTLNQSVPYNELPDSYIIFICSFDFLKKGKAVYERTSGYKGLPDEIYEDGSHIFILNADYSEENPDQSPQLLEFLSYIHDESIPIKSDFVRQVDLAVNNVRSDVLKGAEYMTLQQKINEECYLARKEGMEEGLKQGLEQGMNQILALIKKSREENFDFDIDRFEQDKDYREQLLKKHNL